MTDTTAPRPTCAACGEPCSYTIVWFDGKAYHPNHLPMGEAEKLHRSPAVLKEPIEWGPADPTKNAALQVMRGMERHIAENELTKWEKVFLQLACSMIESRRFLNQVSREFDIIFYQATVGADKAMKIMQGVRNGATQEEIERQTLGGPWPGEEDKNSENGEGPSK